uniref:H-NS histon-like DNA-binding protein n=1 Tax=Burkholderia sp. M701 TaxID=326454 RepID=V5YN74_9BURK|nr:H-NS histone family protein [Burkholderia sp. M701]BAO19020.1 putative H-NS histon-like DNA-binding protein [Burkholderia sp. M701]
MSAMSYKELVAERDRLAALAEEARVAESAEAIEKVRTIMAEYNLTVDDIIGKKRKGRKTGPAPIKYRNPETGQTWSGRGRQPAWLGKRPQKFLVDGA